MDDFNLESATGDDLNEQKHASDECGPPNSDAHDPSPEATEKQSGELEHTAPVSSKSTDRDFQSPEESSPVEGSTPRSIPLLSLLALIGVIWFIEIALGVGLVVTGYLQTGELDPTELPMAYLLIVSAISWTATLSLCFWWGCKRYGVGLTEGFNVRLVSSAIYKHALIGGVGFAVCATIFLAFAIDETGMPIQNIVENNAEESLWGIPWLFMVFGLMAAPLEELYYRGFLFRSLQHKIGTRISAVITVLWFTSVHSAQLAGSIPAMAVIMTLGTLCTYFRIRYDSVIPGIVCHFTYNATLMAITIAGILLGAFDATAAQ